MSDSVVPIAAPRPVAFSDARDRLALIRMLVWAEREAGALGRADAASSLREAIWRLRPAD